MSKGERYWSGNQQTYENRPIKKQQQINNDEMIVKGAALTNNEEY